MYGEEQAVRYINRQLQPFYRVADCGKNKTNGQVELNCEQDRTARRAIFSGPESGNISPAMQSSVRKGGAGGCLVGMELGVLRDADHGEDLLEVGRQAEGLDLLAVLAGGVH